MLSWRQWGTLKGLMHRKKVIGFTASGAALSMSFEGAQQRPGDGREVHAPTSPWHTAADQAPGDTASAGWQNWSRLRRHPHACQDLPKPNKRKSTNRWRSRRGLFENSRRR